MSRRLVLAAAAVVAMTATGLGLWFQSGSGEGEEGSSDAACAAVLQLDGRAYAGVGGVIRTPRPGAVVGEAVSPGCDDGNGPAEDWTMEAHAIPGIDPELAVLAGGRMWWIQDLPEGAADELREFLEPVHCAGSPERTLTGTITGNNAGPVEEDYHVTAPYVATFRAGAGPGLPLERYSSVLIRIRVTPETVGGEDPDLLRQALGEGDGAVRRAKLPGRRTHDRLTPSCNRVGLSHLRRPSSPRDRQGMPVQDPTQRHPGNSQPLRGFSHAQPRSASTSSRMISPG